MNETVEILFGLTGGLALFLYGMNSMSEALQKAAGERMKQILSFLTKNPVMGALAGALVTAVLQSSSATTVMTIGFVSAGLMSLPQAISVIFGANIGTTMTAQLLAFKISDYIYPIIFVGFMLNFLSKKENLKNIGMVIFSFGLLFEGIEIMGAVMKPLANSPFFLNLMGQVTDVPILGVLLGAGMTLVVQSSSATIAVLQNFAEQAGPDGVSSVIGLAGAIPILLGDNIGTTITAILASVSQTKNAKRAAVAHSVFNITGSLVFLFFIPVLTKFIQFISPKGPEVEVISRQIANSHTTFNVVCTLIWLPLIPLMIKIVTWLIRGEDESERKEFQPKYLDNNVLSQPTAAMYLVSEEIDHLSGETKSMLQCLKEAMAGEEPKAAMERFEGLARNVKSLERALEDYISKLFASGNLTEQQSERSAGMLFVVNNIGRIADRCQDIFSIQRGIVEGGKSLSEEAREEMGQCFKSSQKVLDGALDAVLGGDPWEVASHLSKDKRKMRKAHKQFKKAHLARVKKNLCDSSLTNLYTDIFYNLERISENCFSIVEEALDEPKLLLKKEELIGIEE